MSEAAAEIDKEKPLTEKEDEDIKGLSAAVENYGNFFAQNCFPASSGVVSVSYTHLDVYKRQCSCLSANTFTK